MVTSIADYVRENFDGLMVFGDIHSDYESLMRAYHFAKAHNYFFMSLGDLVDRGPFPFETVSHMHQTVKDRIAGFTSGNHDDKFYQFGKGCRVHLSVDAKNTLVNVGPERQDKFLEMYVEMMETPVFSGLFHTFDDITLVHAASHPYMWDYSMKFSNEVSLRSLLGETTGKRYDDGYPVRLYSWIDEIPTGKTVVVGHDRAPIFNVAITEPMVHTNTSGGTVIFMDTGCGKGGFLSSAIFTHTDTSFNFDRFVYFK